MGHTKKTAKGRLDKYYHMAKEQGYRSRAAFKLIQLNKKFNFLAPSRAILDLCAAPGGWMQVARKYCPVSSIIVGIDLDAIRPIRGCIGLQEDITTEKCRQSIRKELKTWKVDCVLHDGAPNVGTAWVQDAYTQVELALRSLELATEFLKEGGWFITKVFRSKDYFAFMWVLNQLFKKVHATKPPSSRNVSAEIFVVCQGYKAPATIDPRLLDPKTVFQDVERPKDAGDMLFRTGKKKAAAEGYEEGAELMYKMRTASAFIAANDPLVFLADASEIVIDEDWGTHRATDAEIKELVKDIKVLNKKDLRTLLKWRQALRTTWQARVQVDTGKTDEADAESGSEAEVEMTAEERDQLAMDDEVKAAQEELRKHDKAKKRKLYKNKLKTQERLALKMDLPGDKFDMDEDISLFSLKQVKGEKALKDVSEVGHDELMAESGEEWSTDSEKGEMEGMSDEDWDDEDLAYKRQRERELDDMFHDFKSKNAPGGRAAARVGTKEQKTTGAKPSDGSSAGVNPLLVDLGLPSATTTRASMWFGQDEFKGLIDDDEPEIEVSDEESTAAPAKRRMEKSSQDAGSNKKQRKGKGEDDDFEVVPQQAVQSTDDDMSEDELTDSDEDMEEAGGPDDGSDPKVLNPQGLAMGTLMLKKKSKMSMVDDAYNRHAFEDDILPEWFLDHEKKHRTGPIKEMPKDMVEYYRQRMKELNARPIKKIAEAKARKKMKLMRKLDQNKKKMESVMANSDMGEGAKKAEMERLLKRKNKKAEKRETKYVVAKKGAKSKSRPAGVKGHYKMVDGRLKKDTRAAKRIQKETKKKRR